MKKLSLVILFMLSCGLFPNIQSSNQTLQPTQIPRSNPASNPAQAEQDAEISFGAVLFRDNFSDSSSGWGNLDVVEGSASYENSRYVIQIDHEQVDLFANPGLQISGGVVVEVVATKVAGSDNNDFGILCRYQDPSNYYYFVISSDGYFAAFIVLDDKISFIGVEGWIKSSSIHTGSASNTIRVECVGSAFRLYANGSLLIELQDNTFSGGDVGLIAGTFDVPGTIIAFDDFVVYAAE